MATAASSPKSRYSRIWAAARALGMSSDEVHDIVFRETFAESLTALTDKQVTYIGNLLWDMNNGRSPVYQYKKRTDEGGREDNRKQRRKIFVLAGLLGWSENDINGFSFSEYGVSRHEWLPPLQCSDMIEALKAMKGRQHKKKIAK